ncbi:MAG: hypothetical protein LCH37_11285 [Bacteroidetes bacterium]|nr:hypothetical protein [Bacteroidota bacterium]
MQQLSKAGKIKVLMLALASLPNLVKPIGIKVDLGIGTLVFAFLFGAIAIPVVSKLNAMISRKILEKPNWNEQIFSIRKPINFFQFGAIFMLVVGSSIVLGSWVKYQFLNQFGLTAILFGFGNLLGIQLAFRIPSKS